MISVLIADDHGIVREGIRRVVEGAGDIRVCAEASDGRETLDAVRKYGPDVVILDILMPGMGGLEALERIRGIRPAAKTILLSVSADPPKIRSAVLLGADGYLLKTATPGEIVSAIREVARDGSYFSPIVAREIACQLREPERGLDTPFSRLTVREREVVRWTAQGLSAKEIASAMEIGIKTVEAHRTSLMRKLGVKKATELVRYAVRHGLIEA